MSCLQINLQHTKTKQISSPYEWKEEEYDLLFAAVEYFPSETRKIAIDEIKTDVLLFRELFKYPHPLEDTNSSKRKAQHHQIADAAKKLLGLLNGQSVMDQQAIINRNKAFNIVYQNLLPQRSPSEYDSLLIYQLLKQILQDYSP